MMRSKNFETQEIIDRSEESNTVKKFSHLMDKYNTERFPDGEKM